MPGLDCRIPKADWAHEVGARNGASTPPAKHPSEKPAAVAAGWEPAVRKIVEFQHLGDDWDGLGARAPARGLLQSAGGLAYLLSDKGVDPPHAVIPGVNGTVVLEWHDPDGTYTEVEIGRPLHAEVMV